MDVAVLLMFVGVLLGCVIADLSIIYALLIGYFLFAAFALKKGFGIGEILKMSANGVASVRNILINFLLIGLITALWRASGTIPSIVCYSVKIMNPHFFIVLSFLLNCLVSFLTGTAFGTSATMGTLCMTIALALNLNPVIMGGAIVSGAYFGDRCSPVSTSALLISELTETDIYANIKRMFATAAVPFALCCVIFTLLGFSNSNQNSEMLDVTGLFAADFKLGILPLIPAVLILLLSLAKLKSKTTMLISVIASAIICVFYQEISIADTLKFSVLGYETQNSATAAMINGGGIVSMLRVLAIVCISSSYSGIFKSTGLLGCVKGLIEKLNGKLSAYAVVLVTALASSSVACNQTLAIMLSEQLCNDVESDKNKFALYLENSAVVISTLFPWSIACRVPMDTIGAPTHSILFCAFNILLPLWSLIIWRKKSPSRKAKQ